MFRQPGKHDVLRAVCVSPFVVFYSSIISHQSYTTHTSEVEGRAIGTHCAIGRQFGHGSHHVFFQGDVFSEDFSCIGGFGTCEVLVICSRGFMVC